MIALPKKFVSKGLVTKIRRRFGESNKLRYVYPIWVRRGRHPEKGIDYIKIKIVPFIINFGENCTIRYTYIQIQNKVPRYQKNWLYLIGVQ